MTGVADDKNHSIESLTMRNVVDGICDKFDQAVAANQRLTIEDVIQKADVALHPLLLPELIAIEWEYRSKQGESGLLADFERRFPAAKPAVQRARELLTSHHADDVSFGQTGNQRSTVEVIAPAQIPDPQPKQTVGPYVLHEKLGQGGMAVVFRATHEELQRSVALKMVRVAIDEATQRFETEAKVIASLKHNNIVQIFDIGVFQERPYLALELMNGGSLEDQIRTSLLSAADAANLMLKLADAVKFAHSRGVIHRDLKPANVLLDADGTPKLSDFGLARLQNVQSQTVSGAVMGTPGFMAPEQAQGAEITTAVDIYGLVAVMYSCLTGHAPFKGRNIPDTLKLVCESEPVGIRVLQPDVPIDLESICLKCLQKSPGARYVSAQELIWDLNAFLAGRPTLARPIGAMTRTIRWCARRPAIAALIAGICISVTAGLAGTTWLWMETRVARDAVLVSLKSAEREKKIADRARQAAEANELAAQTSLRKAVEAVDVMLTAVARDELNGVPRVYQVRRELLEDALRFLEQLLKDHPESPELKLETAKACQRVSDIYRLLGRYVESSDASDRSIQLVEQLLTESSSDDIALLSQIANAWNHRALTERSMGDNPKAQVCIENALKYRRQSLKHDPGHKPAQLALVDDLTNMGALLLGLDQINEAEVCLSEAMQVCEVLADEDSSADILSQMATTSSNYGMMMRRRNRPRETEQLYRQSLELRRQLVEQNPGQADRVEDLAISYNNFGFLMRLRRLPKSAIPLYQKSIELREQLVRDNPDVPSYQKRLAFALAVLARISSDKTEKEALLRRSFQIRQRLTEEFPGNPEHWEDLTKAFRSLNRILVNAGRTDEVNALADELADAHERYLNIIGDRLFLQLATSAQDHSESESATDMSDQASLVEAFVLRADELRKAGNLLRALPVYREADQIISLASSENPDDPGLQRSKALIDYNRSTALLTLDRPDEALENCESAILQLTTLVESFPEDETSGLRLIRCWKHKTSILSYQQRSPEAQAAAAMVIDHARQQAVRFSENETYQLELSNLLRQAATENADLNRTDEAEKLLTEAVEVSRRLYERNPQRRSWSSNLARMLYERGQIRCRIKNYEQGFSDLRQSASMAETLFQQKSIYERLWCRSANELAWQYLICRDI